MKDDEAFERCRELCKREFDAMIYIAVTGGSVGHMAVVADRLHELLAAERKRNEELKGTER